jgi:hypothetical protein
MSHIVICSTAAVDEEDLWNSCQTFVTANGSNKIINLEVNAPTGLNSK